MSTHIGAIPLECSITHGDLNLGTITIAVPLKVGRVATNADGSSYVTVSPDFTDGWFERALADAVSTVPCTVGTDR